MTFLRPDAWVAALLALPLVLLHLRWRRRRDAEVPSLALWRDVAAGATGRRGMRRVEEAAQLAALVLALLCLTAALMGPVLGDPADAPLRRVIVLDASASMNARSGGGSRFDEARAAADAAIAKLGPGDEVVVWTASERPRVVVEPTGDLAAARAALAALRPTLERSGVAGTLDVVRVALRRADAWDALVLTDAVGAATLRGVERRGVAIGVAGRSAATNVGLADAWIDAESRVRVRVVRTDGGAAACVLRLLRDGAETARTPVVPDEHGSADATLPLGEAARTGGLVEVRVASGDDDAAGGAFDDFPDDDAAWFVLAPPPRLRMALVAPVEGGVPAPSPFLLGALRAMPELLDAEGGIAAAPDAPAAAFARCDAIVAEGALPPGAPRDRPSIVFGVRPGDGGLRVALRPALWSAGSHPVTDGADLEPLRIDRATVLDLAPGERAILECAEGVVAAAGETDGVRRVRFGFAPDATTLPLEPAFPVLVRNALRWLARPPLLPPAVRAGGPVATAEPLPPVERLWFAGPADLPPRPVLVRDGAFFETAPLPPPGGSRTMTVRGLPGDPQTAVNWFPPAGFRLVPAQSVLPDAASAASALPDRRGNADRRRPLAGWFASAAAALLAVSLVFLRRAPAPA